VEWIRAGRFRVVNIAGHRESVAPGIGDRVERFLADVFRQLRETE
jgi:Circularly permutated YpsA SLOG family